MLLSNGAHLYNHKWDTHVPSQMKNMYLKSQMGCRSVCTHLKWVHVGAEGTEPGPASAHPADF